MEGAGNTLLKGSDCMVEGGRGRLMLLWFPEQETPIFSGQNMLGLQKQEGAPEKGGPLKMQRLLALISLWKTIIISFFFRDLFV